jgi:L-2-aminoadipate reductase
LQDSKKNIYDYSLVTESAVSYLPNPNNPLSLKFEGSIQENFEKQVSLNPDKVAVVDKFESITYGELNKICNQLARQLIQKGLKKGDVVAILGHRSSAIVFAIMSILKVGAAFTILDPVYPAKRIIDCLMVATPKAFLLIEAAGKLSPEVEEFVQGKGSSVDFMYTIQSPKQVIASKVLKSVSDENLNISVEADDLAVVTFTSGSTGIPKGVLGKHGPLTHYYPWMTERFGFSSSDRFSMQSGIAHDPLQRDIFTPLFLGATIYVPPPEDIQNPGSLAIWFKNNKINVTCLTPAMGQLLATKASSQETIFLEDLQWAFFVGDVLTKKFVSHLSEIATNCGVINMYGSTESQRSVSYFLVPNPIKDKEEFDKLKDILPVGVGMGVNDVEVVVATRFSSKFQLAGVGEMGEIYMRSPHLSLGYKGKKEESDEKFIVNPLTGDKKDKMYRTGDLGRYIPTGAVVCLGRADDQIKIRGFRIELGEINSALNNSEFVKESCTIVRTDIIDNEKILVSYVVLSKKQTHISSELRKFLKSKLPAYMIPTYFVVLEAFPLTPNAKIKREALPKPDMSFVEEDYSAPTNEIEAALSKIWAEFLGHPRVGVHDNFFDLGGHSINATSITFKTRQTIEKAKELPVEILYKMPTISELASFIIKKSESKEEDEGISATAKALFEDSQLDDSLIPSKGIKPFEWDESYSDPAAILLTGCTGFLGTFLLADILSMTSSKVYCLVRSKDKEQALVRIVDSLKHHLLYNEKFQKRIIPLCGDFAQPLLGLHMDEYKDLATIIDVIIHNGALVHWMYPYEKLRSANVQGTKEVIKFAIGHHFKPIHYISTTSVFDSAEYSKYTDIYENTDLPFYQKLKGGYPQSKWVAERLIIQMRAHGLPTCIYRPGYITGHAKTGVWNPDDFLCRMMKGCCQLQKYPDLTETKLDMAPVDFVSKAIVYLCCQKDSLTNHKAFHLVNPNEFFFNSLFVTAERLGYKIEKTSYSDWKKSLFENVDVSLNALYPMLTHFTDDYDVRMREIRPWYDNTNTLDGLADSGIFCPATIDLLGTYYGFLVQCGFMELPQDVSSFAKKKKFFESTVNKKVEELKVDYKNLMRRNRVDSFGSTDDLSGY